MSGGAVDPGVLLLDAIRAELRAGRYASWEAARAARSSPRLRALVAHAWHEGRLLPAAAPGGRTTSIARFELQPTTPGAVFGQTIKGVEVFRTGSWKVGTHGRGTDSR
jgi:hypothetical protein